MIITMSYVIVRVIVFDDRGQVAMARIARGDGVVGRGQCPSRGDIARQDSRQAPELWERSNSVVSENIIIMYTFVSTFLFF